MDKTIAILFLEFRELVSKQIVDFSSTLMRHDFEIRNQRDELTFLKKQIDHLSEQKIKKKDLDGTKNSVAQKIDNSKKEAIPSPNTKTPADS